MVACTSISNANAWCKISTNVKPTYVKMTIEHDMKEFCLKLKKRYKSSEEGFFLQHYLFYKQIQHKDQ